MVDIIQVSDFHFGSGAEFKIEYLKNIISYIKKNPPDIVVCTGDLVHKGKSEQYKKIIPYLNKIRDITKLMCVPGNHDVKNSGLIRFENLISPRRSTVVLENKDAIIIGICSSKDDLSDGEIGDEQLEWLARQFKKPIENRIIALHHHLLPLPYAGRKVGVVLDAGELLELTQLFQVDLVLMGHRHVPHAYILGQTVFLYCGTSASTKVRADESPSFNHITLESGDIEINIITSDNLEKHLLLTRKNQITQYIRPRKTRIEHLLKLKIFSE
ncbi:MAG: metallophosphoesterase family protein [Promethearchaeota archaeon]